jgi:hypothetical protein
MGKYSTAVQNQLVLPGRVLLTQGQEYLLRTVGRVVEPVSVRLLVDTGSGRSSLVPAVVDELMPVSQSRIRVSTSLASAETNLYWVRLEFPGTSLTAIPQLAVARLSMPPILAAFQGVIGRDLLSRWEYLFYEGRRGRMTIRDSPGWFNWLRRQ